MDFQTTIEAIKQLENKDVAKFFVKNSFEGRYADLLNGFIDGQLTEQEVSIKWNEYVYSGDVKKDVKRPDLTVLQKLELMHLVLTELGTTSEEIQPQFPCKATTGDLVDALCFLMLNLGKKHHISMRNRDGKANLVELIERVELEKEEDIFHIEPEEKVEAKVCEVVSTPVIEVEDEEEDDLFDIEEEEKDEIPF